MPALAARGVEIAWSEPYAFANGLGIQDLGPLPRHLLEEKYRADKTSLPTADYWTTAYVGTGPYRLDRWDAGVRIVAKAYPDWFQGPPHIETVALLERG